MILLANRTAANRLTELSRLRHGGQPIPVADLGTFLPPNPPARMLYPTVPMALRAAMNVLDPTFMAANCIPVDLAPMPVPYDLNMGDADRITVENLPTEPGKLGVDFAVAFALSQLAVAIKLYKIGQREHSAYFIEAAGLSAACVCSVASSEIMEQLNDAADDPETFPLPEGILWPSLVADWVKGFGLPLDERG